MSRPLALSLVLLCVATVATYYTTFREITPAQYEQVASMAETCPRVAPVIAAAYGYGGISVMEYDRICELWLLDDTNPPSQLASR